MSEMKRWHVYSDGEIEEDEDGNYVLYADHERVVAELRAENRRRLDDYNAMVALALENKARAELAESRVAKLEVDARRWRKCKRMRKSWWLAALTEAGMMYGRSLDEQIDEQPGAPVDFME